MSFDFTISLIVELTLAVLLAATLVCCLNLDRRLKQLRKDQEGLNGTVQALNTAVINASASIAKLRAAAAEADRTLGGQVDSARTLADELSLLNAASDRIATRMEAARSWWNSPGRVENLRVAR